MSFRIYGFGCPDTVSISSGTDHIGSVNIDNFNVNGTSAADAFNRLRTSIPSSIFSSVLTDDADALAWSISVAPDMFASVSVDIY